MHIPPYRLVRPIGAGGMSVVYQAERPGETTAIAIKVLRDEAMREPVQVERFVREARGVAQLDHPHIVRIEELGETPAGVPFFVMEFLDGEHLGQTLAREGPMPWARVVALTRQIADALALAHARGVVHRDLKPENCVRISHAGDEDFVKLIDFGVAKFDDGQRLTEVDSLVGTPEYLAPEAIDGEAVDLRADVYALGVIMFELLTGRVPFDDPQLMEILAAHRYDPVPRLASFRPDIELPAGAEAIVRRALHKRACDRFADMHELIAALDQVARGEAEPAEDGEGAAAPGRPARGGPMVFARPSGRAPERLSRRRCWRDAIVAGLGILCFIASLGYAFASAEQADASEDEVVDVGR